MASDGESYGAVECLAYLPSGKAIAAFIDNADNTGFVPSDRDGEANTIESFSCC